MAKATKDRIIEISKKLGLSHIGSCLSVLEILEEIYAKKKPEDKVVLTAAHSHLAHLVVQEKYFDYPANFNTEEKIKKDIHCNRDAGCDASGGSLGHLGIAVGMAIANPDITIYAVMTDGSSNEGSEWEALRLKKLLNVDNLRIIVNMNGYSALENVDKEYLTERLKAFCPDIDIRYTDNGLPELEGVQGHYAIL